MPSMRDIRRRIKSVTNTAQITKAMQMVAAAKMKRSQQAAINGRPYAIILHNMLTAIHNQIGNEAQENPLCVERPIKNEAVILVTTDILVENIHFSLDYYSFYFVDKLF